MTAGSGPPASPTALVGTTVGNSFTLEKLLGQGRHGNLFEGRHSRLGQRYAVRVLSLDQGRKAALVGALAQCAAVVHPNFLPARELMALPDEQLAICTPLLPGQNLSQRVATQGKLTATEGTAMVRQAASALHALHLRGLVHGNLSAGNLYFAQYDDIAVDNALGSSRAGQLVQLLDPGLYLCDLQPGQPLPTPADDQQALGKLVLAHVADLSPGQQRAIERTQEALPESRYSSMLELWRAFDSSAKAAGRHGPAGSVATALVPMIRLPSPASGRRRTLVIATAAALGLGTMALLGFVVLGRGPAHDPAATASPPAANAEVHLAFDVTPSAAMVMANGNTTPVSSGLTLPRSDTPVALAFSAAGYQPKTVSVVPTSARTIAVTLTKVAEAAEPVVASKAGAGGDEDEAEADSSGRKHKKREHRHHRSKDKDGGAGKDGALPALMKIKK